MGFVLKTKQKKNNQMVIARLGLNHWITTYTALCGYPFYKEYQS
ncbi:Hypothetical protein I595_2505 [Croceitalea dokdonensis DOKDO 023]|uniref:Uncharacterized protein n=1 Tax=Croceitalea dokdonensis DOKDO 023 TaxID=1300341 RepID=A0A0P7ARX9_9FLAO|nr:Hypothetical protein I595_2505 [Croceitalea dokdonensis DOKDO 023]